MENLFVVLGGMGTMATESFVHQLNKNTQAETDQDYLNYIVLNHATVPDRTAYILNQNQPNPVPMLKKDIDQTKILNPDFYVLTCNTAHYFYDELIDDTNIEIKHMPKIAVERINQQLSHHSNKQRVMILATSGTIESGIYNKEIAKNKQLEAVVPDEKLQQLVMSLIYDDIKEHNYLNNEKFNQIIQESFEKYSCDYVILGCTELSLMQDKFPIKDDRVIDAQLELVRKVLRIYNKQKTE